ncbi:unnamed protein product [Microthlaspi erraticum]|uniref:Uncharacterized protein n=1 Tax=Microthlaspi erraticum TaxID=1685480 RepID=A0A6D2L463_9BRAS|nr:unnamed protein product [Microthlaspi erraticum]
MMKKKKQSISQSSIKKNLEPSPDSSPSPSPRLLSLFRSKLGSGKDLKHMLRGMRTKTMPGLSSQSRIVRCPNCQKLLQEPLDATSYKCGGCESILHAKRLEQKGNDKTIPLALLSSENRSLITKEDSAESGSQTPRSSPSVEKGYHHSETVYKHETSDIRREWMRKADDFSDSDVFDSARSSPYNSRSNASEWTTQHEGRYEDPSRFPLYQASPSPSSAYEYGYSNSPFHGSQASASEQSYYHHQQPNQFKQYGREGWFQEPVRFQGETSREKYNHWPSQAQLNDLQYRNLYESNSSATTPHRSVYSECSYQAAAAPNGSTYSEKSSLRNKKKYVKPVVKRYVLPSAGGAPFVTCSYCLELLELPQVSLQGKQKRYQVRCGSCSGVIKFPVGDKADTVLDSPGLADETIHQDSASDGHEEIYPDDSHLSSSDNGSGDRICKGTDISSGTIVETSRNHLEKSEEAHSEKSTEMDGNIFERVGCSLEEFGYEKNDILKPEEIFGDGSVESLEVPLYNSTSSIEAGTVSEPLNKNEYVCETRVLSEKTKDTQEFNWEETQGNEAHGGEISWEEITRDKPELHLEKSLSISDSICDSSSSNGETFEDRAVKEYTEHISSTFSATPQSPLTSLVNEKQMFIGHPDQSGEATFTISRIQEEQSKYEYENSSEGKYLDKTISDRVRYELAEEPRYETNETIIEGTVVSLGKELKTIIEGDTGEERSVTHQMDPQDEVVANSNETVEPVYPEGSGYAGERTWAETVGDRAGLHLEEYESNYENHYSKPLEWTSTRALTFRLHENELGTTAEPDGDANARSISRSTDSFTDHESSKEIAVPHGEEPQLVNDYRTEALVENGPLLQLEKWENESMKLEETFEWTSGRALTFRLHENEPGTVLEQDENDDGRSGQSSRGSFNEHERAMNHEEELQLVNNYETRALKVGVMAGDGHSLHYLDDTIEQESMMFHFEMSQDKQETPRQIFKQASGSSLSSEDNESPSKKAEVDSEADEEILEEHFQNENEKTGLTSEAYAHIYSTTEPSEIVGLRHALYQTQTSPLRSPLTSPIHTPIGSPLHYLMGSPMQSYIVSPLRSPINSSGSLSDVLFFGKRG